MSQDIRSFFSVLSKKPNKNTAVATKKRPITLDSSDDEIIQASPIPTKEKTKLKTKKRKIIDSDSDDEDKKGKTNLSETKNGKGNKIQKVNAADVFGSTPIKQTKVETKEPKAKRETPEKNKSKTKPPKLETELGIHDDPDFEQSLLDLDNDMLLDNVSVLDKTIEEALSSTPTSVPKHKEEKIMLKKKRKMEEDEDTGIDKDQEIFERKRQSVMLYQKYLNRSGPARHGTKDYPKGKANCLDGLCFLRTGVLDSLEGPEFEQLVKDHGGRTVHAVSRKVNYLVVGVEAGPAKLAKAESYNIPTISEDEFLDLILLKSGKPRKYAKNSEVIDDQIQKSPERIEEKASNSSINKKTVIEENSKRSTTSKKHKKTNDHSDMKKADKIKKEESPTNILSDVLIKKENFYGKASVTKNDIEASKKMEREIKITPVAEENLSWADKYRPGDIKSIIGQQGDKSCMRKLLHWLGNWCKNHSGKDRPKISKPSPWSKTDDGGYYKCALLSGPPGIGKTTTATLVAKELGYDIVEFNASDTRSKRLLHEEVSQLLSTNSLANFVKDGSPITKKHVLLMDEVDGMAGNEDRGGMQELIQLIKKTSVPIICMCNDRNHTKVRSLANYCFDLRFSRPRLEQIRGAMMSVCFKENLKIKPEALSEIISGTGMDLRQTLNHLSMWTVNNKSLSVEEAQKEATAAQKDTILGPWEVVRKVFSEEEHKNMSIGDRFRLFYYDYSIGPLFVQENYLQVQPHCPKPLHLERASLTADAISKSDLVDKKMRSSNNWSLLEVQAIYSSVLPGHYMEGHVKGQINFPGWLGKNSKKGKFKRLVSELQSHTRISTSGSRKSLNLDYVYHLRDAIIKPLITEGTNGIEKSMEVMRSYNLLREDLDSIMEVSHWVRQKDPMAMLDSKVKAAFTRAYNKDGNKLPYSVSSAAVKKKTTAVIDDNPYEEEEAGSATEDDDDIAKDVMIKAKKKPAKTKGDNAEAGSSKKGGSKGRGSKKK